MHGISRKARETRKGKGWGFKEGTSEKRVTKSGAWQLEGLLNGQKSTRGNTRKLHARVKM
jgi:hypothetical protein